MLKLIKIIVIFYLLTPPVLSTAATPESQKNKTPLKINSDSAQMNYHTGVNIYSGNVIATHGQSKLTGGKLTTYRNKQHQVNKVVTTGDLAEFHTINTNNNKALNASAETILFYPIKHLAVFKKKATAKEGKDIIKAPLITYNTKTQVLQTQSSEEQKAHILLNNQNDS